MNLDELDELEDEEEEKILLQMRFVSSFYSVSYSDSWCRAFWIRTGYQTKDRKQFQSQIQGSKSTGSRIPDP